MVWLLVWSEIGMHENVDGYVTTYALHS